MVFVTNHVLSGVIIGQALPRRPFAAFVVGVGSHLLLDACPHWSCDRRVPEGDERFLRAAKRDGIIGLATMAVGAIAADHRTRVSTIAAMVGAALLDVDKPLLHFIGVNPFPEVVQRVHKGIQNESPNGLLNEVVYWSALASVGVATVASARNRPGGKVPAWSL
jgi:hypothetical protein